MTTTTVYDLRAQTDKSTKTWHLGAAQRGAVCFCGVRLMTPGDERKFAAKYPAGERQFETSPDLSKVTCRACQRTGAWRVAAATGQATVGIPAHAAPEPKASEVKAPSTRKRPSAATRAAAKAEQAPDDQAAG